MSWSGSMNCEILNSTGGTITKVTFSQMLKPTFPAFSTALTGLLETPESDPCPDTSTTRATTARSNVSNAVQRDSQSSIRNSATREKSRTL
jgi:hypothetical protein